MVTPPLPWTGVSSGATILSPVTLARTGLGHFNQLTSLAQCQDNLRDMFDALTALSSVPWRINNTVCLKHFCLPQLPFTYFALFAFIPPKKKKMLKVVSALYRTKKAYPEVEIVPEFINKEEFSKRAAYAQAPPEKQEEVG